MNGKIKSVFFICLGLLFGMSIMYIYKNFIAEKSSDPNKKPDVEYSNNGHSSFSAQPSIGELTQEKTVIDYVKQHRQLPDYYITKNEARQKGWNPSKGNLCEVLPGHAIGGDRFSNRERGLPQRGKYFEADVNYNCGNRNADRIIFTKNGDVYLTKDHYKTFEKQ
ncbi:ribonuclease [Chryseobacterium sp. RU37D]|uniref:ribonuclease domain-containing protein n=1 Tax=Chryseobacterium sp. RU37D TaxID=1907397 RepID=UPI000956B9C4|nr:ribonuclease domain-containing protein [Chryseobacterium sp. RU37D]SIQ73925.1 ribonuclease [Chryseobacterium sp. RU37D]